MGGMTIGLMGNAEQATVTNIGFSTFASITGDTGNTTKCLVVTVSNTGNSPISITNAYVNTVAVINTDPVLPTEILKESSANIVLNTAYISGEESTVKLTTAEGNNLVLSAFAP
jgi:hypothetical protein